jgi:CAP12/Pycsar effector protein, TIR domain/Histidine-specific methyltransferase, SAM-dependent
MARKRIFIASATEAKDGFAVPIAKALSEVGYEVVRWWQVFEPGDWTLPRLQEIAATVDGAVFLCLGTDKGWYRGGSVVSPRDNVLLELGLFLNSVGVKRSVVVTNSETKLPSDLAGLTCLIDKGDVLTIAETIVGHFRKQFTFARTATTLRAISIEVDPKIAESTLRFPPPNNWHQRALYLGTQGARNWLRVADEPAHLTPSDQTAIRNAILEAIKGLSPQSFVSFGPGSGDIDREIAVMLRSASPRYFPVDISHGLLVHACETLSEYLPVPLGILSDFEERFPFIAERLDTRVERPILAGLLGHTLCNLDRFELTFLRQIESWLKTGDQLLIQVVVALESWKPTQAQLDPSQHTASRRRFFSDGLARQLGAPAQSIFDQYSERIDHRTGQSDVPQAISLDVIDRESGTKIQSIRWYQWQHFLDWITSTVEFDIKKAFVHYYCNDSQRGEGIVLLEKR